MKHLPYLRSIMQKIASANDTSGLPQMIIDELVYQARIDIACFYIPTASEQTLAASAVYPQELWSSSPELGTSFLTRDCSSGGIGKAIRDRSALLITDPVEAEARGEYIPFFTRVTSELIVPMFEGFSLAAVLVASRFEAPLLGDSEKEVCEFIADLMGLFYSIQREKATRNAGLEFLKSVTQLDTDAADVLFPRFLENVGALLPSRFMSLWLYNSLDETLVIRGFYPPVIGRHRITFEQLDSPVLSLGSCLSSATVREQRTQIFESIQINPENANNSFARQHQLDWFISFPVVGEDRKLLAILNVYPHVSKLEIEDTEIEAASVLISQLAPRLALSSIKRREAMLDAYGSICRKIRKDIHNSASWDALAARISVDMQCEASSIFLFRDGYLMLRGSTGIEGNPDYKSVIYKIGEGLTGLAFKRQTPIVYYRELSEKYDNVHLSKFREKLRTEGRSRSILIQAIVKEDGDAVGVIRCNNKNRTPRENCGRFSEEDSGVIKMIGMALSSKLFL